jgi:membrane-bound lytic murein transglycosylase A
MRKALRTSSATTLVAGISLLLGLGGCSLGPKADTVPEPPLLAPVPEAEWPVLEDDLEVDSLVAACQQSLAYLERVPSDRTYRFGDETFTAAELATATRRVIEIVTTENDPAARTDRLRDEMRLMRSRGRDNHGEVLFTGYYEPLMPARKEAGEPFIHPVYALPDDLLTIDLADFGLEIDRKPLVGRVDGRRVVPYPDRDAIDFDDALTGKAGVIGYLSDLVDLFFLHVQGSGTLLFPSGEKVRAGYAGSNGRAYRSIGRLLLDEKVMTVEEMSMQAIKRWLADNPEEVRRVLAHNPSYVFFRALPTSGGPLGCYGLPVTAGRSIATDRRIFPAPVVAYIVGTMPSASGDDVSFARFAVNQDTGGAIRGPGRVDIFFGAGDQAGELAGRTKHLGRLYFLLPRR